MDVSPRSALLILALFTGVSCESRSPAPASGRLKKASPSCQTTQISNQFVVSWKSGAISQVRAKNADDFVKNFLEPNKDLIAYAEHDQKITLPTFNTKTVHLAYADNWGAENIRAHTAWRQGLYGETSAGQSTIVAVIDSGIDIFHPQLAHQVLFNEKEIPNNGIDDDHNGYIDDYYGYNFLDHNDDIFSFSDHGTHVSGIIAAEHRDSEILDHRVQGVAPGAKLLAIKFLEATRSGTLSDAIMAIDYAASRGAQIINASWGGNTCSLAFEEKIRQLATKNILFVAAAGNSFKDLDINPEYPAAIDALTLLSVGAITPFNGMTHFSNYGATRVHLFAPGLNIISTVPGGSQKSESGTSMAAPFVTGAAALLKGLRPQASAEQIRNAILRSVTVDKSYINQSHGRLNVEEAIALMKQLSP